MEQEDKVSAAALSLGSGSGPCRTSRALGQPVTAAQGVADDAPEGGETQSASGGVQSGSDEDRAPDDAKSGHNKSPKKANNVRRIRIERMMSKAELARRANLSVLTIDRVERGYGCRMDTKRKILEALGLSLADRVRVFGEEE